MAIARPTVATNSAGVPTVKMSVTEVVRKRRDPMLALFVVGVVLAVMSFLMFVGFMLAFIWSPIKDPTRNYYGGTATLMVFLLVVTGVGAWVSGYQYFKDDSAWSKRKRSR